MVVIVAYGCPRRKFLFRNVSIGRRVELDSTMDNYLVEVPLGSTDRRIPICEDKLFDELHDDKSSLAQSWADHQIAEWVGRKGSYSDDMEVTHFGYCRR